MWVEIRLQPECKISRLWMARSTALYTMRCHLVQPTLLETTIARMSPTIAAEAGAAAKASTMAPLALQGHQDGCLHRFQGHQAILASWAILDIRAMKVHVVSLAFQEGPRLGLLDDRADQVVGAIQEMRASQAI
jgi:hypothetical protein